MSSNSKAETLNILKTLTYHQGLVLYWVCRDLKYEEIAERYGYKPSWCVWQMSYVYKKLGLDRKDVHWNQKREIIKNEVCPLFRTLIQDDITKLEDFPLVEVSKTDIVYQPPPEPPPLPEEGKIPPPEPPPDFYPIELYGAWLTVLEDKRHEKPLPEPPPPPNGKIHWDRIFLLALFVVAVAGLAYWFGTQNAQPISPVLSTETQEVPSTQIQAIPATETQIVLPTETIAPTDTPPPTETLLPSPTPVPTETPLFIDDFTNGRSDRWQTLYGNTTIVDGALNFTDTTLMVVDEDWTDYEVSFELSNTYCQRAVRANSVAIGLRYQDANNMVAISFARPPDACRVIWYLVKDGEWNRIPNSESDLSPADSEGKRRIVLRVEGNAYSFPLGTSVVIEDFASGGIAVFGDTGTTIDNFQVVGISR